MFALIIHKVLLAWMPVKCIHILCTLVTNPEKMHFHQTGSLSFDHAVCNANCCGIVAMHQGFGMYMTHILEDASKNNAGLAIME
jgi:hypothetical protein